MTPGTRPSLNRCGRRVAAAEHTEVQAVEATSGDQVDATVVTPVPTATDTNG